MYIYMYILLLSVVRKCNVIPRYDFVLKVPEHQMQMYMYAYATYMYIYICIYTMCVCLLYVHPCLVF